MTFANRPTIVLVGPMGAGKSTVGRHLAELLHWNFLDSDRELEARCGADIPWIFDIEGESGFRRRETLIIKELVAEPHTVLATGGGAILAEENRTLIKSAGVVIYLTAPVDELFQRVIKDKTRPLLQVENPRETYEHIFNQRDPLYREVASTVIVTDNYSSPLTIAQSILDQIDR